MENEYIIFYQPIENPSTGKKERHLHVTDKGKEFIKREHDDFLIFKTISESGYFFFNDRVERCEHIPWCEPQQQPYEKWTFKQDAFFVTQVRDEIQSIFSATCNEEENAILKKQVTAKVAATKWAIFSQEIIAEAVINNQNRYETLKKSFYLLQEAQSVFNYQGYKQDEDYFNKIQDVCSWMEKEMDFCLEKMNIIKFMVKNDYSNSGVVSKVYREKIKEVDNEPVN